MIEPVAFSVFGLKIYWYGLFYVFGFFFSYLFVIYFAKDFGFKKKFIEDVFLYCMIFSVIGGRVFYIIFYNLEYYIGNPLEIFAVWNGGMSIHGGIFFAGLTLLYFSRKANVEYLRLTDLFVIPASLGLAFGRLANFINQELVGKVTNSEIGVVFPLYDNEKRVPYQLFAGFKNLIVFNILLYVQFFKKVRSGVITALFLILYSFGRFFIDFYRVPTVSLGIISMGQLLSLIFGLFGCYLLVRILRSK